MTNPNDLLIDRMEERQALRQLLGRPRGRAGAEMALVTGRRRVGKTFLLSHTWPADQTFHFVAAEGTSTVNRRELIQAVNQRFGLALDPGDYPNWRTVFKMLFELNASEPLVIVLDEFQYLMGKKDSAPSSLAATWDLLTTDRPLALVLCGSAVRTMEALQAGDAALHGRFARTITVQPFDYFDAATMLPFATARECAVAYGVVGGTPQYLEALDGPSTLDAAIASAVLAPGGHVRQQVETLIDQESGLRNRQVYKALLRAMGAGRTLANEVADYAGTEQGTATKVMLSTLTSLGYVAAERNHDAKSNEAIRFRLSDPALRFQHEVVEPFRSELARYAPADVWTDHIAQRIDTYMGRVFEFIAEQAYHRHRTRLGLPMVETWGRWEGAVPIRGTATRERQSIEIDVVAKLSDGRMLTGAVKWGDLGIGVHNKHLRDLSALANSGYAWARQALEPESPLIYAAGGELPDDFKARAAQDGHPVIVLTLEEMYRGRTVRGANGTRSEPQALS